MKVQNSGNSDLFSQNLGTVTELVLTLTFIPFLVYFMLSWQEHARTKTVQLFPPETRTTAYVTLGQISLMVRSFIAGNVMIGVFMSVISMTVFGFLGLPYFYFLGVISGFSASYLIWALRWRRCRPLAAGLGTLKETGTHHHCGHRSWVALVFHECALSQSDWQTPSAQPLLVTMLITALGMAMGRDGSDSGGSHHGRCENCL